MLSKQYPRPRRRVATKAEPTRTCIGCRRRGEPDSLVRLAGSAHSPTSEVRIGRNVPGRGAWLCVNSPECFDQAVRRRAIVRALNVELSEAAIARLRVKLYGTAPEGARPVGRAPIGEA